MHIARQVTFSMLEIYNEQVRDLLVSTRHHTQRAHGGLRVRLRPGHGFYCEGLKVRTVIGRRQKYLSHI